MVEHWRRLEDIRAFGYHHRTPYLIEDIVRQAKFAVDRINPILRGIHKLHQLVFFMSKHQAMLIELVGPMQNRHRYLLTLTAL